MTTNPCLGKEVLLEMTLAHLVGRLSPEEAREMANDTHKGRKCTPPPPRLCLQQLHQETPLSGKEEEEVKKAVKLTHNLGKPTLTRKQKEKGWPFKSLIVGLAEETEIDTNS